MDIFLFLSFDRGDICTPAQSLAWSNSSPSALILFRGDTNTLYAWTGLDLAPLWPS